MNYEFFIAKRIIGSKAYKSSISAPIIKIGIAAIAIGIIVMMIAIATGIGLQQKIRDKVVAFNGHITITNYDNNNSQESVLPISKHQDFYPDFKSVEEVNHVQGVASKFGVIRTETDFEGVYLKGVGADYNWNYFKEFLIAGKLPDYTQKRNEDVLVSKYLANRLNFKVGNKLQMVFAKDDPEKLPNIITYNVVGIYNSGFQDLDAQYLIGDIRHIQRINRWKKDEVGHFEVFINNYNNLEETGNKIHQNLSYDLITASDSIYRFDWKFYNVNDSSAVAKFTVKNDRYFNQIKLKSLYSSPAIKSKLISLTTKYKDWVRILLDKTEVEIIGIEEIPEIEYCYISTKSLISEKAYKMMQQNNNLIYWMKNNNFFENFNIAPLLSHQGNIGHICSL